MTADPVRALSVARPWAALILHAGKDVENRSWSTSYRGLLVIHASQSWDEYHDLDLRRECGLPADPGGHPTGYLGVVELVDVHHDRADWQRPCSGWSDMDCWHWMLASPRPFPEPVPGPGRLGLYIPPTEVLHAVGQSRPA